MRKVKVLLLSLLAGFLLLTTTTPVVAQSKGSDLKGSQKVNLIFKEKPVEYPEKAFKLLSLINKEREDKKVAPLKMSKRLMQVAMERSAESYIYFDYHGGMSNHERPNGKVIDSLNNDYNLGQQRIYTELWSSHYGTASAYSAFDSWRYCIELEGEMVAGPHLKMMLSKDFKEAGIGFTEPGHPVLLLGKNEAKDEIKMNQNLGSMISDSHKTLAIVSRIDGKKASQGRVDMEVINKNSFQTLTEGESRNLSYKTYFTKTKRWKSIAEGNNKSIWETVYKDRIPLANRRLLRTIKSSNPKVLKIEDRKVTAIAPGKANIIFRNRVTGQEEIIPVTVKASLKLDELQQTLLSVHEMDLSNYSQETVDQLKTQYDESLAVLKEAIKSSDNYSQETIDSHTKALNEVISLLEEKEVVEIVVPEFEAIEEIPEISEEETYEFDLTPLYDQLLEVQNMELDGYTQESIDYLSEKYQNAQEFYNQSLELLLDEDVEHSEEELQAINDNIETHKNELIEAVELLEEVSQEDTIVPELEAVPQLPNQKPTEPEGEKPSKPEEKPTEPEGEKPNKPEEKPTEPEGEKPSKPEEKPTKPEGEKPSKPEEKPVTPSKVDLSGVKRLIKQAESIDETLFTKESVATVKKSLNYVKKQVAAYEAGEIELDEIQVETLFRELKFPLNSLERVLQVEDQPVTDQEEIENQEDVSPKAPETSVVNLYIPQFILLGLALFVLRKLYEPIE